MWEETDVIYHFSDSELDEAVKKMWLAKAAATIITQGIQIEGVKRELDESTRKNWLPKELHDAINAKRAKHLFFMWWISLQSDEDDRMWINMDNFLANFDHWVAYHDDPRKSFDGMLAILKQSEALWDFLMRTPEDYLKVLIYHLKLKKVEDMHSFFQALEDHREGVVEAWESVFFYGDPFYFHFREATTAPTEFISSFSPVRLSKIFSQYKVESMQQFIELFLEAPYMYPFFLMVSLKLTAYFSQANGIQDVAWCTAYFADEKARKVLIEMSKWWDEAIENVLLILKHFQVSDIQELHIFDEAFVKILSTAPKHNLEILLSLYAPTSIAAFKSVVSHKYIQTHIEWVEYARLLEVFSHLHIGKQDTQSIALSIFENSYDPEVSKTMEKLSTILKKYAGNLGNLWIYVLYMLSEKKDIGGNTQELLLVLGSLDPVLSHQGTGRYIDFSRLVELSKFMGGNITSYLAQETLKSTDPKALFESWEQTIAHYKQGHFDPSNELHINLEYRQFKALSSDENIAKYMGRKFSFEQYTHLFHGESFSRDMHDKDKFELECVAYEAQLLKTYILKLNEQAKKQWRRLMVIPNLTYGYLPLCAIAHELEQDENIEICIGPKVGSTESHNHMEVLSSTLFKGKREYIVETQPVIVVIDGTQHLVNRNGNGKSARYPDAYQWYLNQVIALNYAFGDTKVEDMDYTHAGKTKADLQRLIDTPEFVRTAQIYKSLAREGKRRYEFGLWNTSNDSLIIRGERREVGHIEPFQAERLRGPAIVFCNVWVHHNDLPVELKKRKFQHIPAYFDDSGRIINFEYQYNATGIHFVNSVEAYLQSLLGQQYTSTDTALLRHKVVARSE